MLQLHPRANPTNLAIRRVIDLLDNSQTSWDVSKVKTSFPSSRLLFASRLLASHLGHFLNRIEFARNWEGLETTLRNQGILANFT